MILEVVERVVLQQVCRERKTEVAVAYAEPEEAAALTSYCKTPLPWLVKHQKLQQITTASYHLLSQEKDVANQLFADGGGKRGHRLLCTNLTDHVRTFPPLPRWAELPLAEEGSGQLSLPCQLGLDPLLWTQQKPLCQRPLNRAALPDMASAVAGKKSAIDFYNLWL